MKSNESPDINRNKLEILKKAYNRYGDRIRFPNMDIPEEVLNRENYKEFLRKIPPPEFKKFPRYHQPNFSNMAPGKIDFGPLRKLSPENWEEIDKKILLYSFIFWSIVYSLIFFLLY